jgi:hypothetical protein
LHIGPFVQVFSPVHVLTVHWSSQLQVCPCVTILLAQPVQVSVYKRGQIITEPQNRCHITKKIRNTITFLSPSKTDQTQQKNEEHIEVHQELHHPKTLTEFSYHKIHRSSSNSSHNRIQHITQHRIPHQFHKNQTNSQGRGRSFQRF